MIFSIITVNFNNANGLEKTIKSVISQEKILFEFIIIDGASTDNSLEVIKKYESHIDYYISEPDKGIYNAMNKGINHANGEYVIFMNSSDEFAFPEALHKVYDSKMDEDFIFGGWIRIKKNKQISFCMPDSKMTLYTMFYNSSCVCHQATFTKLSTLKELQGYDESLKISADICFLMKALVLYNKTFKIIPLYITNFDVTGISGSDKGTKIIQREKPDYFKKMFPYIYDDYIKMHNIIRFSPNNIINFIKWRISKIKE